MRKRYRTDTNDGNQSLQPCGKRIRKLHRNDTKYSREGKEQSRSEHSLFCLHHLGHVSMFAISAYITDSTLAAASHFALGLAYHIVIDVGARSAHVSLRERTNES